MSKRIKNSQVPVKRTLNLVLREEKQVDPARMLPAILAAVVLLALVGKFGVADRFAAVQAARDRAADVQDQYLALLAEDADYDEVVAEYNRYSFGGMTDEEKVVADRAQVLDLIEQQLLLSADIASVELNGNELNVEMSGITLEDAAAILARLNTSDLVSGVTVYTAGTGQGAQNAPNANAAQASTATITMTITLADNPVAQLGAEQPAAATEGGAQ